MKKSLRNTLLGIGAGTMISTTIMAQNPASKQNQYNPDNFRKNLHKEIREENRQMRINSGNNTQIYFGGGVELTSYVRDTYTQDNFLWSQDLEYAIIGQYAMGIKSGKFGIGALFGFKKNIVSNSEEVFISTRYDENSDSYIEIGRTTIDKKIDNRIMQPGLEVTFFPIKHLGFGLGAQYNIHNKDTTGTVYQTIMDEVGNVNGKLTTLDEKIGDVDYFTLSPTLELKFGHMSIIAGGKFTFYPQELEFTSAIAGLKLYLGSSSGNKKR